MGVSQKYLQKRLAYESIWDKLVRCELAPGARLSDVELSQELGLGRMPVREAIIQLEAERFVERIPRYGTFVRELTTREVLEAFDMRAVLESHAARLAAVRQHRPSLALAKGALRQMKRALRSVLAALLEDMSDPRVGQWLDCERQFHEALVQACGNSMLCHTARRLRYFATTMNVGRGHDPADFCAIVGLEYGRHARLYRTVRTERAEAAAAEGAEHVRIAARTFLHMHSENLSAGVPGEATFPTP